MLCYYIVVSKNPIFAIMQKSQVKKHLVNLGKILSDWIVIYEIIEEKFVLILLRTGTHQDLFKNY